ncbi:AP-5 complex subunit sigma-1-like [Glandiceps talaboti]
MVYAFIIHTLEPGSCRVLYSSTFGQEDIEREQSDSEDSDELKGSELRTVRKEQIEIVAKQVQSEFSFRRAVSGRTFDEEVQILNSSESSLPYETGIFRLRDGDPFKEERLVVWTGTVNCAFVLVCYKHENRIQAESVLRTIVRYLQEYVRVISRPTEAMTKADKVTTVIHQFLPNGQILFMNHRVIRQFEKEMEALLSGK